MNNDARKALLQGVWGLSERDGSTENLKFYLRYCHEQARGDIDGILFVVNLLKSNTDTNQSALIASLEGLHHGIEEKIVAARYGISLPKMSGSAKSCVMQSGFRADRELSRAVRIVWATGLVIGRQTAISGLSTKLRWKDTDSLHTVFAKLFQKAKPLSSSALVSIKRSRLSARYLKDHAGVELEWTSHLPDHLYLDRDGKKLRVFNLVSLLEMMKGRPGALHGDLQSSLQNACFPPDFIVETLMTLTLVFPPTDRVWLESLTKPHRQWPRWWVMTPELDQRLCRPFDVYFKEENDYEKFERPILNVADLFEVYPHWAVRLQLIHEEAEDPTPGSAVGRWADRKKGPRHAYWVTVAAFALAILFGISGTVLSTLQLWVSYCQWQEPAGGSACGRKQT